MPGTFEIQSNTTDNTQAVALGDQHQTSNRLLSDCQTRTVNQTNNDQISGDNCGIQPVVVPKDGGTVTIDEFNRVTQIQDAAHREFQFGYDKKSGELNQVTNDDGTWKRQIHHGKYTDEWKNENGQKWQGDVEVTPNAYTFTKDNQRTTYTPGGRETKEYISNGSPYYTETISPDGKHSVVDNRLTPPSLSTAGGDKTKPPTGDNRDSEQHFYADGKLASERQGEKETFYYDDAAKTVRAVWDHSNNSLLNYDEKGNLSAFKDARGRSVTFNDYDASGNPHTLTNQLGQWHKVGPDLWNNDKTNKTVHVHVQVNKNGYTFTELNGKTVTRNADGTTVEEYRGMKTTYDVQGKASQQFADGTPVKGEAVTGKIQFDVKKGDTKSGRLSISGSELEIVHARGGDIHAHVEAAAKAPVAALQDGLVVYSYNHDAVVAGKAEQRGTQVIGMSDADMEVVNQYRKSNPNSDIVVMQCYDKASKGVRYEIYAGLSLANAAPGDRIAAGSLLGTAGDNGYSFGARKGRLSGKAVELTM